MDRRSLEEADGAITGNLGLEGRVDAIEVTLFVVRPVREAVERAEL